MKRIEMIYMKRGYSKERIKQIALKMRLALLMKAGETRKAFKMLKKYRIVGRNNQIEKYKNTTACLMKERLLKKLRSNETKRMSYVVTYDETTKIHESLLQLIKDCLDKEVSVAHKVFPGVLQQVYPKWRVSRMLDEFVGAS